MDKEKPSAEVLARAVEILDAQGGYNKASTAAPISPEQQAAIDRLQAKVNAEERAKAIIQDQPQPITNSEEPPMLGKSAEPQEPQERFCINDPVTKLALPVRDATTAQLHIHLKNAQAQHQQQMVMVMNGMQQASILAQACAAMSYEIERRDKTFTIVRDLGDVNLRKGH